jgi:regulator of sigma E protease
MSVLFSIIQLVVALSVLIILHEIGHFLAARLLKVEVEEFGLGYPPRALTLFEVNGTKYSLNWLPLGGFVRLKGEVENHDAPGGLHAASPWARLMIYFAGPLMNLLVGILIFAFMYTQTGAPDLTKVQVVGVSPASPAEAVGLQDGDIITVAAGNKVTGTENLSQTIYSHLGEEIDLSFMRGEEVYNVSIVPRENPPEGEGAIGIYMNYPIQPVGFFGALPYGAQATYYYSIFLLNIPGEVIRGAIDPSLARPVGYKGIYDAYQYVQEQEEPFPESPISLNIMRFFASITISLGVLNLLPIPALDGGRILFTLPEIVIRRRIPLEWQNIINMVSITALIALFLYINLLDFTNPIQFP